MLSKLSNNEYRKTIIYVLIVIVILILGAYIYFNKETDEYNEDKIEFIVNSASNNITSIDKNNIEDITKEKENIEEIIVHVTGAVVHEGIVSLKEGQRVIDAIEAAGGATEKSNLSLINLAYVLEDGMKIYVPTKDDKNDNELIVSGYSKEGNNSKQNKQSKVNINTATVSELENLQGIGSSIANKIIEYRKKNGSFKSIEDLKNVSGIGESKFNNIKNNVCVK